MASEEAVVASEEAVAASEEAAVEVDMVEAARLQSFTSTSMSMFPHQRMSKSNIINKLKLPPHRNITRLSSSRPHHTQDHLPNSKLSLLPRTPRRLLSTFWSRNQKKSTTIHLQASQLQLHQANQKFTSLSTRRKRTRQAVVMEEDSEVN